MPDRIYLDHAATTPMRPEAQAAVAEGMARWANPSSPHAEGRAARRELEAARARIKAALGWRHELIFTSGATEAVAIALIRQSRRRPALVGAVEHIAVLRPWPDARHIPVGGDGLIDAAAFGALLRDCPEPVVAIQHANSETGILQPIEELSEAVDRAGGVLLADCAQSAGKLALPPADLIAVSAHKFGGPPGIGALLVRDLSILAPDGPGQERGYRPGTENLPAILGFAAAAAAALVAGGMAPWVAEQARWRTALDEAVENAGGEVVGPGSPRIPTIASYRLPGIKGASLLIRLDLMGIAVSAGSACSSGSIHVSHVLTAMGMDEEAAGEVIRVSFGWSTTWAEVERFAAAWAEIAGDRRRRAA